MNNADVKEGVEDQARTLKRLGSARKDESAVTHADLLAVGRRTEKMSFLDIFLFVHFYLFLSLQPTLQTVAVSDVAAYDEN